MNNKVKFLRGTSDEYAVAEKDSDTIYFTTDDGKLYIGDKEISGSDVTIDDTLSDTSTNPVQNKAVKQAIDNKADKTVATISADGLMSAEDKSKLDDADNTYALKSKYGDTTINIGRMVNAPIGEYSTSLGTGTVANGYASTAEGAGSQASELASHAGGYGSKAIKKCSFAHGYEVYAKHDYETAFGKHNVTNDDTLFSIGDGVEINTDGSISIARHNAFEITKTGGMLHDKDIATTDLIPDLSAYAKTADVPNIKVNSAVDADTVGEKSADDFPQIIDFGGSQTDTKTAVGKLGKTTIYRCINWTDFPDECTDGQGLLVSVNYSGTGIAGTDSIWAIQLYLSPQTGVVYKRHIAHTSVGNWCAMYSADNKPYISGSATVAANSTTCTSNHGFIPSAVIWWDGNDSGVATSFNETQFAIKITSSVDRTINYLIFK